MPVEVIGRDREAVLIDYQRLFWKRVSFVKAGP
jgi:hypothetical protein